MDSRSTDVISLSKGHMNHYDVEKRQTLRGMMAAANLRAVGPKQTARIDPKTSQMNVSFDHNDRNGKC